MNSSDIATITVAGITALSSIAIAAMKHKEAMKSQKKGEEERDLRIQAQLREENIRLDYQLRKTKISFPLFFKECVYAKKVVKELLETTEIDRFVLLEACNGSTQPSKTTAYFQMREQGQREWDYIEYSIDDSYRQLLYDIKKHGYKSYKTPDLGDSELGKIYKMEEVTESMLGYLAEDVVSEGFVRHSYCSFATHHEGCISEATKTRCIMVINLLRSAAADFLSHTNSTFNGRKKQVDEPQNLL